MLQINLIPLERRRKERTPLPRFVGIIAIAIVCVVIALYDIKTVVDTNGLKIVLAGKQDTIVGLEKKLAEFPKWQQDKADLLQWASTAEAVKKTRPFKWWTALDVLLDVLADFPTVWIVSFQTSETQSPSAAKPTEATIRFDCRSVGPNPDTMLNLRRRLKNTPELTAIFDGGIIDDLYFDVTPLAEAKEEWAVVFLMELYRLKR